MVLVIAGTFLLAMAPEFKLGDFEFKKVDVLSDIRIQKPAVAANIIDTFTIQAKPEIDQNTSVLLRHNALKHGIKQEQ